MRRSQDGLSAYTATRDGSTGRHDWATLGMQNVDFVALEFVQESQLAFICWANNHVDSKPPHELSQQANCSVLTLSCSGGDTAAHTRHEKDQGSLGSLRLRASIAAMNMDQRRLIADQSFCGDRYSALRETVRSESPKRNFRSMKTMWRKT